jgi:hypothetical protein
MEVKHGDRSNKYLFIPPLPEGGGGYTVLPLSVCPSFRPSKIIFVTFFSVTVDGRNLIFGHKRHIAGVDVAQVAREYQLAQRADLCSV